MTIIFDDSSDEKERTVANAIMFPLVQRFAGNKHHARTNEP